MSLAFPPNGYTNEITVLSEPACKFVSWKQASDWYPDNQ